MEAVGLFAGIGGIEAGLERAGHTTTLFSEVMPAAAEVLARRFYGIPNCGDVRSLRDLPSETALLTAGFPCQDLSQAGMTQGLEGNRSGLVGEVFRIAARSRPEWILLENVPFMLQLRGGDAMRRIVDALEDLGYRWAWRVVDTFGFGLPHRRERVFLLASTDRDPADVLLADERPLARPLTAIGEIAHGFYWTEGKGGLGWAPDAVPTLKNGSSIGIASPPAVLLPDGSIVKPDIRDAERLQGFPKDWTLPAELVAKPSLRWSLIGNSVSVPVSEWIGLRLENPGHYEPDRDIEFPQQRMLPKAARFDGQRRTAVHIGVDPIGRRPPHLTSFLRHAGSELSARATAGFLARTRNARLRFAPGFIAAVEAHLRSMDRAPALFAQMPEKRVA